MSYQVLLDRCAYDDGRSYFPGFFSQDIMRASAYKYANVSSRSINHNQFSLLICDREGKRGFKIFPGKYNSLVKAFPVFFKLYFLPLEVVIFLHTVKECFFFSAGKCVL